MLFLSLGFVAAKYAYAHVKIEKRPCTTLTCNINK